MCAMNNEHSSEQGNSGVEKELAVIGYFKKHRYDVDAIEIYFSLQSMLEESVPNAKLFSKKNYLEGIRELIINFCQEQRIDFEFHFNHKNFPLIIPSSSNSYFSFLTYALSIHDIPSIKRFLEYQQVNFMGNYYADKNHFVDYLEHLAYDSIKSLSLFETDKRLEKIMEWIEVEREKEKAKKENTKKKKAKKKKGKKVKGEAKEKKDEAPKIATPAVDNTPFYYWKFGKKKLDSLYEILVRENKMEANEKFSDSFRVRNETSKNRTKWLVTQTQLVFLWYLIFDGVNYQGESIYRIIIRLFVNKKGNEFNERGLNSTYNNISKRITDRKIPTGLNSIKKIVEELKLNSASKS